MIFHVAEISLQTWKKMEILDTTEKISQVLVESGVKNGVINLWVPHATAAVAINEHDPDLWNDILKVMEQLVPIKADYRHNAKYRWSDREQNAHAHILNCLIKPGVTIPVEAGRMLLGTWQSILFIEMDGPRRRSIHVQVMGE